MSVTTLKTGRGWAAASTAVANARGLADQMLAEANSARDGATAMAAIGARLELLEAAVDDALDAALVHLFHVAGASETVQLLRRDLGALRNLAENPPPGIDPVAERLETIGHLLMRLDR